MKIVHVVLLILWFIMVPVAIATGWIYSIPFVSACSIYANAAIHWGALQGKKAQDEAKS